MSGGRVSDSITGQVVHETKIKLEGSNDPVGDGLRR